MRSCCHLFFALMSTSQEALIHNLANGGKERKGRTREQSVSFPSTEQEPITAPDRAVAQTSFLCSKLFSHKNQIPTIFGPLRQFLCQRQKCPHLHPEKQQNRNSSTFLRAIWNAWQSPVNRAPFTMPVDNKRIAGPEITQPLGLREEKRLRKALVTSIVFFA